MAERTVDWPSKAPQSVLDFTLDLAGWLSTSPGDTLTVATVAEVVPAGELIIAAPSITGAAITLWISGGIHGTRYAVTVGFETAGGREDRVIALLPCVDPAEAVESRVGAGQITV